MDFEPMHQSHGNPVAETGQNIYFAYGSNLSFDQMAKRCPNSRFLGRARLYKYEFQINERGFANVIETSDPRSFVDGLCYRLVAGDESSLDRSEGVPFAYQKKNLEVEFFPAADIVGMDVMHILRGRASNDNADDQEQEPAPQQRRPPRLRRSYSLSELRAERAAPKGTAVKAMVYLSTTYVTPGRPWDEYIERMTCGFLEALRQGISTAYVEHTAKQWLGTGKAVRLPFREQAVDSLI